jgi:hypothetical protein
VFFVSKRNRKETFLATQGKQKENSKSEVNDGIPETVDRPFTQYIAPIRSEPTRYSAGWRKIPSRDGGVGWARSNKDLQYEAEYFSVPYVPDTLAENAGFNLARDTNNNRTLAVEMSQRYGLWGSRIFMKGFDAFSKPAKYERALPNDTEERWRAGLPEESEAGSIEEVEDEAEAELAAEAD